MSGVNRLGMGAASAVAVSSASGRSTSDNCPSIPAATIVSAALQALSRAREDGKRLFRAAPLHRHLELKGYPAPQIVTMYTIVTAAVCAVCLLFYLR